MLLRPLSLALVIQLTATDKLKVKISNWLNKTQGQNLASVNSECQRQNPIRPSISNG